MVSRPEQPGSPEDPRFTAGLFNDVLTVLEAHGYHPPEGDSRVYADALLALGELVRAFEGTSTDTDAPADPGTPSAPEGGDRR